MRNLLFIFTFLLSSLCSCNNNDIEIIIDNKTDVAITNMLINVQGKLHKVGKIEVNETYQILIHQKDIIFNNHDFRIESSFTNKLGKANQGFYYSDISGKPNSKYKIEVSNTKTIIK